MRDKTYENHSSCAGMKRGALSRIADGDWRFP